MNAAQASHSGRIAREYPACFIYRAKRQGARRPLDRSPKSASTDAHLQTLRSAVSVRATGQAQPCEPNSLRRPQRPGNPGRAEKAPLEPSPAIHPREPPGTASASTLLQQDAKDISRLRGSTVPEAAGALKRKVQSFCEEAVEDGDLLWKGTEKAKEISEGRY
jgi:hypothetical protein